MSVFSRIKTSWLLAALAAMSAAVYWPSLGNGFVGLDDSLLIYDNAAIQQFTFASVRYVFTSYDPELYIPLTLLSYQIEHALFGLQPFYYHLTNLLLFVGSVLLVYRIAFHLSGQKRWAAFLCAVLFAVHPLHVETVAWAAARKDLLANFFFFAAMAVYLPVSAERFGRQRRKSLLLFLLGLLSKVSVATLPAILFLLERREGKTMKESMRSTAPFFALSAVFLSLAVAGKRQNLASLPLWENTLLFCKSIAFALWKLVAPFQLSVLYEQTTPITLWAAEFAVPVALVVLLIGIAIWTWRRWQTVSFALLFFLITFLPTIGTFSKNHMIFYASDRYAYLPSFGILFLAAMGVHRLRGAAAIAACVAVFFAFLTVKQQGIWKSTESLYRQALAVTPTSIAYSNLGAEMIGQERFAEAEELLIRAVQLDPQNPAASAKLGQFYVRRGKFSQAQPMLLLAVQATDARPILSMEDFGPYYFLGEELMRQGKTDDGIAQFRRAVERGPQFPEPHYNLGLMYEKYGRPDEAAGQYAAAVDLYPYYVPAMYHLAGLLAERGSLSEARDLLQRIVDIDPQYEKAASHLAGINGLLQGR